MASTNLVAVSAEAESVATTRRRSQKLQVSHTEPVDDLNSVSCGNEASLPTQPLIPLIRSASRLLVRELGFMSPTLAGTQLSPSSVHALLEISTSSNKTTATTLSVALNLEKSSVSRMVKKLVELELVREENGDDKREKILSLTDKGWVVVRGINDFADKQVASALANLDGREGVVLEGIEKYAIALRESRLGMGVDGAEKKRARIAADVEIRRGYSPGILGRCLEMHMEYYSSTVRFGAFFEAQLATGLGELLVRISETEDGEVWAAVVGGSIVGTVWMDSLADGGVEGKRGHLRAFIVDGSVRGKGVGRRLLDEAVGWADERRFEEVELWTFKGLDAARTLYERCGFALEEEMLSAKWGAEVMVQHFVRRRDL